VNVGDKLENNHLNLKSKRRMLVDHLNLLRIFKGGAIHTRREPFGKTYTFPVMRREVLYLQRFGWGEGIAAKRRI